MVNFIVCEFNPFHNGHAYLLDRIHEYPNICIMSSHVTQRGEFAFTDKWTRTKMALISGADLVLELPAPFAMGQASRFASGAMEIARATGLDGRVCFGSENAAAEDLKALAAVGEQEISPYLKKELKAGHSYASALSKVYTRLMPQHAHLISTPNNLLGLEYMKAAPEFEFLAIPRQGVAHDAKESQGAYCSASSLRLDPESYRQFTPPQTHDLYDFVLNGGRYPDADKRNLLWMHALRALSAKEWDRLVPDGVGRRMFKAVQTATTVEQALASAKTKCCTLTSLRRLALKAFLGDFEIQYPPYLRILGANETGKKLLAQMRPTLPLLTKPAAVRELSPQAQALMEYESRLTDTYMLLLHNPRQKGLEFLTSPIIL